MSVKTTLVDSRTEGRLFTYLNDCWSEKLVILLHQSIEDVFELEDEDITERERGYLDNTHFDFVIASREGVKPLLIIEFDGMEGGYSTNGEYIVITEQLNDCYRKLKFDLKIKICEKNNLPIIIISWNEINGYFEKDIATIVNGLVGEALYREEFNKLFEQSNSEFERAIAHAQDEEERQAIVDSFGLDCEMKAIDKSSIITQESNKLRRKLRELGVMNKFAGDISFGGAKKENLTGMRCWVKLKSRDENICETVYVRKINTLGINCDYVAKEIAELNLCRRIINMYERQVL